MYLQCVKCWGDVLNAGRCVAVLRHTRQLRGGRGEVAAGARPGLGTQSGFASEL